MKLLKFIPFLLIIFSCGRHSANSNEKIVTVSIAPFGYFVERIGGDDFRVNVMVPPGADPHVYEPVPGQIRELNRSVAYISNGYLGFEMVWLPKFYEINREMQKLSLGDAIEPIASHDHHEGDHLEGADPHYWVSPKCALIMAASIRDFLGKLNPAGSEKYKSNYETFASEIRAMDEKAAGLFAGVQKKTFMIYHPNLAYVARDYGLNEVSVEQDGKEPSPSGMKNLIDLARSEGIHSIFVQKEYDKRNAKAIADEIGAGLVIIDPLSPDWKESTSLIIDEVYKSLN